MIFDFFRKKDKQDKSFLIQDSIRGCMMAGAAGDALGYPVEFWSKTVINFHHGAQGITQFKLAPEGKALVSDDTQMTLFTANGLLMGMTRWAMCGENADLGTYTDGAYVDWFYTQTFKLKPSQTLKDFHYTWLRDLPELAWRRAPGRTCMIACESLRKGDIPENDSKGCGGIMRVAPMGLVEAAYEAKFGKTLYDDISLAQQGAVIAKMTHRHPLGYYPAALMTLLIAKLIPLTPQKAQRKIENIIEHCLDVLKRLDPGEHEEEKRRLTDLTHKAMHLAKSSKATDADTLPALGEGWVADEAWAISIFCALRHIDSVHDAVVAAVNHDGDSDSTGSMTGNIMGAIYGYEVIKKERLFCPEGKELEDTLELSNIILALADDIFNGCCISKNSPVETPEQKQWYARYMEMQPALPNYTPRSVCDKIKKMSASNFPIDEKTREIIADIAQQLLQTKIKITDEDMKASLLDVKYWDAGVSCSNVTFVCDIMISEYGPGMIVIDTELSSISWRNIEYQSRAFWLVHIEHKPKEHGAPRALFFLSADPLKTKDDIYIPEESDDWEEGFCWKMKEEEIKALTYPHYELPLEVVSRYQPPYHQLGHYVLSFSVCGEFQLDAYYVPFRTGKYIPIYSGGFCCK